jgi:hypothetical protein
MLRARAVDVSRRGATITLCARFPVDSISMTTHGWAHIVMCPFTDAGDMRSFELA